MALDAGSVFATLGGDFSPKGFLAFDSAMKRSALNTKAFEDNHRRSMDRIGRAAVFAGKAVAVGLGVGLVAAAGAIGASVVQAVKFDSAMRNVNSIAQLSEKRFKTLKTSVLALAASSKQGPEILAKAMYDLVSSGFNASQSLTILKASAKGASAGMTDAKTATAAVAAVLNAYKLPASQAMHVTDQLFQTVNRGVLTFEQLATTIGDALPFAASLGVGLDQVGAAVSTMTKNGINAAETMTRLRRLFVSLLKPNKDMAATIHDLGFKSGEAMIKQKGLQGALEALVGTTNGSKAAVAKLFPDIRALGGALILTGKNAKGAEKDLAAFKDVTGATNRALAEQKKSTQYQWQAFIAGVQAAAVVIGTGLLPMINKLIGRANSWLQGLQKDGSIDRWAKSIAHGFQAAGDAIAEFGPQVLHVVAAVGGELLTMAGYAKTVVDALISIGGALNLGDATSIKAIVAAIAGFKIASLVLPSIIGLGGAIATMARAGAGVTLSAMFAGVAANPIFAVATAVSLLAAGLVILSSRESDESKRAHESADAHQQQADAISAAHDASLATVGSQFAVTRALMEQATAFEALKKAREGGKPKEIAAAQLAYDEASLRVLSEQAAQTKNLITLQTERAKVAQQGARAAIAAAGQLASAQSRLNYLQSLKDAGPGAGKQFASAGGMAAYRQAAADVARFRAELAKVNTDNLHAANLDLLDFVNRLRLAQHVKPIGPEHAAAIGRLQNAIKTLPKSVQTRILVQDQAALLKMAGVVGGLDKIGQIQAIPRILADDKQLHGKLIDAAAKLAKLGMTTETATVLASTDSAQSKFQTLLNMLAAMQDKRITVTTTTRTVPIGQHKASGGKTLQGRAELAVIGEGAAPEYVIPTEPRYRARGIDLLMSAAQDLGVSMFRGGKGKKKPAPRGGAVTGALDPAVLQDIVTADQTHLDDAIRSRDEAKQALKDAVGRDKTDKNRAKAIKAARAALEGRGKHPASTPREIKALKAKLAQAQLDLKALTAYEASISQTGTQADTAITQMDDADETSNPDLFNSSKKTALAQIDKELASTRKAIKGAKKGSPRMIELQSRLAQLQLQRDQIDHRKYAPGAVEGPAAFNLDELLSGAPGDPVTALALAGLTETPADDLAALAAEKAFLEQQLSGEQSGAKRRDWIIGLAEAISGINSQMSGLSGGTADGGPTADQQALLDQANARADAAQKAADINAKYIGTLSGSGDLGLAGVNSTTSKPAGPNQITINTLHPGDPQTLAAIASASVRGIDQQGGRPAKGLRI